MPTKSKSRPAGADAGWDTYWQGTADAQAFNAGGANHPAIGLFWESIFRSRDKSGSEMPMLDIASGNGAVVAYALKMSPEWASQIHCVDLAPAAIDNIETRFPGVTGLVCDASSIPLDSESFQLVTSQFGIEYAGESAVGEAARLLAPGGELVLMMHCQGGEIETECSASLQAIDALQSSDFIRLASAMFDHGFKALRGADRAEYEEAAQALAPAISQVEGILRQFGTQVAGDTVVRLYNDVGRIHEQLPHYDPEEVAQWLSRTRSEMTAYRDRMASMISSALDEAAFLHICETLQASGCEITQAGPMRIQGLENPLAWIVRAARPSRNRKPGDGPNE